MNKDEALLFFEEHLSTWGRNIEYTFTQNENGEFEIKAGKIPATGIEEWEYCILYVDANEYPYIERNILEQDDTEIATNRRELEKAGLLNLLDENIPHDKQDISITDLCEEAQEIWKGKREEAKEEHYKKDTENKAKAITDWCMENGYDCIITRYPSLTDLARGENIKYYLAKSQDKLPPNTETNWDKESLDVWSKRVVRDFVSIKLFNESIPTQTFGKYIAGEKEALDSNSKNAEKEETEKEKTDEVKITKEAEFDTRKAYLQAEAIKNRIQAQAAQDVISKAKTIPRGLDSNLPNVDLNQTQENVFDAVTAAEIEVKDLQADATVKEQAGKLEAITATKEIMGKDTVVTTAKNGEKYQGEIIAKTDIYAIQRLTDNRAVLYEIKNISDEANVELGAKITLYNRGDVTVQFNENSQEMELEEEREGYGRERGSR